MLAVALLAVVSGCSQTRQLVQNPFGAAERQRSTQYDLAQVTEREGNLFKAEKAYRELAEHRPKETKFHHRLGIVLVKQGRLEEGIAELQQAAELSPENAAIMNDLGYAQLLMGEYAAAETTMQRALELDPRDIRTRNNLALATGYAGNTQTAYELFRRHQSEAEARSNVAYILAQRGELKAATSEYDIALSKNPDSRSTAEALLQLTEMQRGIDASESPASDVQLAGAVKEVTPSHSLEALPVPEPRQQIQQRHLDLVELLGELENAPPAQAGDPVQYYEWQAAP